MHPRSLFSLAEHLDGLSKDGDPLEALAAAVEFERFRPLLIRGLGYGNGAKGGRPAFDPVVMFTVLVVQRRITIRQIKETRLAHHHRLRSLQERVNQITASKARAFEASSSLTSSSRTSAPITSAQADMNRNERKTL